MKSMDQHNTLSFSFPWLSWPNHQKLLSLLSQKGAETRFIGGAVRDTLLAHDPQDFDCATTHPPTCVIEILEKEDIKVVPTGISHGTVTAILNHTPYQITTLRRDVESYGRHAKVIFTDSWQEDAARRDFTMNALSLDAKGQLFDYFDGVNDLKHRKVCFIGVPAQRIQEDYLRILRFFRFQTFYGDTTFEAAALEACIFYKNFLNTLARERITQEFLKILYAPSPFSVLEIFEKEGFFPFILGQETDFSLISALLHLEKIHNFQASPFVRLSALIGRRQTVPGLCLSKAQNKMLKQLGQKTEEIFPETIPALLYQVSKEIVQGQLYLQSAEKRRENAPAAAEDSALLGAFKILEKTWNPPAFPLNGHDVLALGGKDQKVKELLQRVEAWWVEQNFSPDREACLAYLKKIYP